ncbi:MAG: ABC transporter permease subunit [Verrucomicrobia bacterium]|nr:ABC transporter permease subunit [Verrucomicrobiota bacterium]
MISKIGRKSFSVRALYIGMYVFLICGAASMVYPFLLMISGSTKGAVDTKYFDVVPRFLHDDAWLYRKHIESLFNESLESYNITYGGDATAFDKIDPPAESSSELVDAWKTFLAETELPAYAFTSGHLQATISRTIPWQLREFKAYLRDNYGDAIDAVNQALGTDFINWNTVSLLDYTPLTRRDKPEGSRLGEALYTFQDQSPVGMRVYGSVEGFYKKGFLKPQYSRNIDEYNQLHQTAYASYTEVQLPRSFPVTGTPLEQQDWESFVRNTLAVVWVRADERAAPAYQRYLRARYETIEALNKNYETAFAAFEEIPVVDEPRAFSLAASDWEAFLVGWREPEGGEVYRLPTEYLRIHSVEFMFRDWLVAQGLATPSAAATIRPPQAAWHYTWFMENQRQLRWEFATRNYKTVADYLLLHGRGVYNTVVYCGLAILMALTINPLAAYAMSRYRMPSSYKILLFLMCTMAFPPMVTQIPNFLMLRQFGLLNTFAALVLPGMANGYAIFLLKGFFDAQPRELYESAQIDGASEWTIFWQITMSLSKPILAVIALQAFTGAYSNFMFAFVVCQDEKMWTLMVWLYQLQQRSGQAVMYASLIIAAIPTFFIFLFCQNLIMRGIVVPSEK